MNALENKLTVNNQDIGDASFCRTGLCAANQSAPQGRSFVARRCARSCPTLRNKLNALSHRTGFHVLTDFVQKRLRCREKREKSIIKNSIIPSLERGPVKKAGQRWRECSLELRLRRKF